MATSIVRFEPNVPQTLALKFSDGKEVDGPYRPQMFYSTTDGRTFYLDLPVAQQLTKTGIRAGQPFTICRKSRPGGAKGFDWEIRPEEGARPAEATPPAATAQVQVQHHATQPQPSHSTEANSPESPIAQKLMGAIHAALDAARESEVYAARFGRAIAFSEESIRAFAITAFLQWEGRR